MDTREAVALLESAVPRGAGIWADVGSGEGTFTRALAELLGPGSRIYAVDHDEAVVRALERWAEDGVEVIPVQADFARPFALPGLAETKLDGILFANALHFVPHPDVVLSRLAPWLRPGGRVVVVEYDRRAANPWVPYPIPTTRLPALAASAGLAAPAITATRPSAFGGVLYVAMTERLQAP
ncbi:MAG TPA: class I SAM-dependent methyltransferase [Gemmatimonadales bacterium]